MYFSTTQLRESVSRLYQVNPFFGTAFLALKKAEIPIGSTKQLVFSRVVDEVLQEYYRPIPNFLRFYLPFKSSTPDDRWNNARYASTTMQRITADTFGDVLLHSKGSKEWGWKSDYIDRLLAQHLKDRLIPVFDLAVWLFRDREWYDGITKSSIVELFFIEFKIRPEERKLFDFSHDVMLDLGGWLEVDPISIDALFDIIGEPADSPLADSAILIGLELVSVGPVRKLDFRPATRLNLVTGDNGLGKTFLLDCMWWSLTGRWATEQAYPNKSDVNSTKSSPAINFEIKSNRRTEKFQGKYDRERNFWSSNRKNALPGLSIYARSDGSFAIWDPARRRLQENPNSYDGFYEPQVFLSRSEVIYGKLDENHGRRVIMCQGLIQDWLDWQYRSDLDKRYFVLFSKAIELISPHAGENLVPGGRIQLPPDLRYMPTLQFPYGEVPFIHCSAGIQRIICLVYMLLWSWLEHAKVSEFLEREPERNIVLLVDEMEAHLHPFWQRTIVPALMDVVHSLNRQVRIQAVVATHSPFVLASVESIFDQVSDQLFNLRLSRRGNVELDELKFMKLGRIDKWLTSDAFGLGEARSLEAESAINQAEELQKRQRVTKAEVEKVTEELRRVLGSDDQFWARWIYFARNKGIEI